ncbi:MAG: TVP38/TMEM64 family protein [Candidatus Heimdallarchaeota archaeon]|nr:TVP38/TMEM64 family protein [Candidatus Heimdallarchaeota archaeon]MCK4290085.1 TVP38/TMEM64 family protein [Candidatus Heimdallarchaeota archaeon]
MEESKIISEEIVERKDPEIDDSESKKFQWTKDKIVLAIIFSIIILASIALLIVIIVDKEFLFLTVRDWFIAPIIGIHVAWQVLLFLALMILQSLFAPIPSELILLSGGMIFGWVWGSVIGVAGSMVSSVITFYISKRGGRAIIDATGEKIGILKRSILVFDIWIKRWGLWAILVGRAVPVIMFDPISYAAGLANVKDWQYFLATFIGSIPRSIFYVFLGQQLLAGNPIEYILNLTPAEVDNVAGKFNTYFFIIFGILVFMFLLSNVIYYLLKRKQAKEANELPETKEDNNTEEETISQDDLKESIKEDTS